MSDIFMKAGFEGYYYQRTAEFYKDYFDSDDEMNKFFEMIFQNDEKDNRPRKMMNQIVRWVSLANDIEKIRPGKDALRIIFIRACIESLSGIASEGKTEINKQNEQKNFLANNLTDEDKNYISTSFEITSKEKANGESEEIFRCNEIEEFEALIYQVRNNAVHDGDYWSTQVFAKNDARGEIYTWISSFYDDKEHCTKWFESAIEYKKFIECFVRAGINYIKSCTI